MKKFVIEKDKLAANSRRIQEKAGVPVIAVLKADGYGFGMEQMAKVLRETGIRMFAVTEPGDATRLRELGYEAARASAVDMFPRTGHVETVVLLSRAEVETTKLLSEQ